MLCSRAITYLAKGCGALPAAIGTLAGSFTAALTGVNRSADEATARNPAQCLGKLKIVLEMMAAYLAS
jgi:hypothetical protein